MNEGIERRPEKKDFRQLVGEKLDVDWQSYLEPRKPDVSLVASKEVGEEEDVAPLLHSGETQPGVLHSAPGSPR